MTIPPPPWWQSLLLEDPLPLILGLLTVGVVLRLVASRSSRPKLNYGALAAIAAAVGAFLLAHYVQTARETLIARSEALVQATAPLNTAAVNALLTPDVAVTGPQGARIVPPGRLRDYLDSNLQRFPIESHAIMKVDAAADGDAGKSIVSIRSQSEHAVVPGGLASTWALTWRKTAHGQWRVGEIRWLSLQGQPPPRGAW